MNNYSLHMDYTGDLTACWWGPFRCHLETVVKHLFMIPMLTLTWYGGCCTSPLCYWEWWVLPCFSLFMITEILWSNVICSVKKTLMMVFYKNLLTYFEARGLSSLLSFMGLITLFPMSNLACSFHSFLSSCTAIHLDW